MRISPRHSGGEKCIKPRRLIFKAACLAELEADGLDAIPAPNAFPRELEKTEVAYQFWKCSAVTESRDGCWASGTAPDGHGTFEYLEHPQLLAEEPELGAGHPFLAGTGPVKTKITL
jgi:Mn-containing catalase